MKVFRRVLAVALVLALVLALSACGGGTAKPSGGGASPSGGGAPSGKQITIGLSLASTTNNPYLMALSAAVQASLEAKGWKVILQDADMDAAKQSTQFSNLITQGVDLIVYWAEDASAAVADAKKASDAGIPVINFFVGADPEADQYMKAYVGADQEAVGATLGKYANDLLKGQGNYVIVNGMEGASDFILRAQGFSETLDPLGNYSKLAEEYTSSDRTKAQTVMENFLTAYPNIDLVFCCNDDYGIGAYNAIAASGRSMYILGIDGTDQCLQLIKDGKWAATIYQPVTMMGDQVAMVAEKLLNGETIDYNQPVPIILVDKTNVDQYLTPAS